MTKTRAHVYISGRVHGVFFRENTKREAQSKGVVGWVKNLEDGRVEAVFEGGEEAVKAIVAFCHRGPKASHVTGVDVEWQSYTGEYEDFQITY